MAGSNIYQTEHTHLRFFSYSGGVSLYFLAKTLLFHLIVFTLFATFEANPDLGLILLRGCV
jgi:hypothetical protein